MKTTRFGWFSAVGALDQPRQEAQRPVGVGVLAADGLGGVRGSLGPLGELLDLDVEVEFRAGALGEVCSPLVHGGPSPPVRP